MPADYDPVLHVVLVEPEIPYNTGSVGRTCVAVGAKLWLVRPLGFRIDDYHLRRAGLDYWQHLHWEAVDNWQALQERLPLDRAWMFTTKATQHHHQAEFRQGDVLVFGRESQGLPPSLLAEHADHLLRIPCRSDVRSLNLSTSVAVACYECLGQWARR